MMVGASEGLDFLRAYLNHCAEFYLSGDLPSQRLAVACALFEVAKYLEAQEVEPVALLPIIRPALALAERHQSNALDLMFTERPRAGRPSGTTDGHLRTAILATFANVWLQVCGNDGRKQSCKLAEAARKMRGGWFGNVSGSQLKVAREVVSREASDHPVVEFADRFGQIFENIISRDGPERAFTIMAKYVGHHPVGGAMGILKTPPVSPLVED